MVIYCVASNNKNLFKNTHDKSRIFTLGELKEYHNREHLKKFIFIVDIKKNARRTFYWSGPYEFSEPIFEYENRDLICKERYETFDVQTIKKLKLPFEGFIDICIRKGYIEYLEKWKNSNIVFNYTEHGIYKAMVSRNFNSLIWLKNNGFEIKINDFLRRLIFDMLTVSTNIDILEWLVKYDIPFLTDDIVYFADLVDGIGFPREIKKVLVEYIKLDSKKRPRIKTILEHYNNGALRDIIDYYS